VGSEDGISLWMIEGNADGPREGLSDGEKLGASLGISERTLGK